MILLNPAIQGAAPPDPDRLHLAPRSILELVCGVAGHNSLLIGLATVNDDPLGMAMPLESLAQKALGGGEGSPLAEPELQDLSQLFLF